VYAFPRWYNFHGNGSRGEVLRDGGIAETLYGVTGVMQAHCDSCERRPIPATKRGPKNEYAPERCHLFFTTIRDL
jgi:hypothetical protein